MVQEYDFDAIKLPLCATKEAMNSCYIPFKNGMGTIFFGTLCLIAFIITILLLKLIKGSTTIIVTESKHIPADIINYVFPYVVSFMSLDYQGAGKIIGFLIFLTWMFLVTYKSGQIMLNPLLIIFGWRLYEIKYQYLGGTDIYSGRALSDGELQPNMTYKKNDIQDILTIKQGSN
jgi:hypothetical protein